MYQPKIEKDIWCPFEYGFDVFGGKWRPRIICVLADKGVMRYSVLRSEMTNITDAILSTALKSLINDGIVERRQYEEVPLRVEYSLSEMDCRAYSRFIIFMVFIVLSEKPCMCRRLSTASVIKL